MKFWACRERFGNLKVYISEDIPQKGETCFYGVGYCYEFKIDNDMFPEVTWDNSPQQLNVSLTDYTVPVLASEKKIDWEQRRWDLFCYEIHCKETTKHFSELTDLAGFAYYVANKVIEEYKNLSK